MIPSMNWSGKLRNCQSFSLENEKYISCWEVPKLTEWLMTVTVIVVTSGYPDDGAEVRRCQTVLKSALRWRPGRRRQDWTDLSLFLKVEPLDLQEVKEAVRLEADGLSRHVAPDPGRLEENQWVRCQVRTISRAGWPGLASVYVFLQFTSVEIPHILVDH